MSKQKKLTKDQAKTETVDPNLKKIVALNVAEKPSVARAICESLVSAKSGIKSYPSSAKFNPVMEFYYRIRKQPVSMIVTSVSGHFKNY